MKYGKYEITLSKNNSSYVARYLNNETGDGDVLSSLSCESLLQKLQANLDLNGMEISDLREDLQAL